MAKKDPTSGMSAEEQVKMLKAHKGQMPSAKGVEQWKENKGGNGADGHTISPTPSGKRWRFAPLAPLYDPSAKAWE